MTLDEAIKHCFEVAHSKEMEAEFETDYACYFMTDKEREECKECSSDHRQLAERLTELKQWRRVYGVCPSYEMCIPECKEGYNAQIAEYKRLLKSAAKVLSMFIPCDDDYCSECIKQRQNCDYDDRFKWLYAAEVFALIGEEGEQNG